MAGSFAWRWWKLNPRKIGFLDQPPAEHKKRGVYQENKQPILVDYWGNKYHVLMDLDSELRIVNPEFMSAKPNQKIEKYLPLSSVIYSAGPDGNPNTWEDNVCSWRWLLAIKLWARTTNPRSYFLHPSPPLFKALEARIQSSIRWVLHLWCGC